MPKLRPIVGPETSLDLYKTLIELDYCDIVYDTLSAKDNAKLQKLQNSALKSILQVSKRTSTADIPKEV